MLADEMAASAGNGFVCLGRTTGGNWRFEHKFRSLSEAEGWYNSQSKHCRIYCVTRQSIKILFHK